jgi:prevent-host-death family protein
LAKPALLSILAKLDQEAVMTVVNMLEAKTQLSRLVEAIESGAEAEIVIARNGRPAARLVPLAKAVAGKRIGLLEGKYPPMSLEDFNAEDETVAKLFKGEDRSGNES